MTPLAKRTGILNLFAEDTPRATRVSNAAIGQPTDPYMDDDDEDTKPGISEFDSIPLSERLILQSYQAYTPQHIKPEVQKKQTETKQREKQVSKARKVSSVIELE